jgi:hypothetical protein
MSIAFGESTKEKSANRGMNMIREMDRQAIGRIWRATEAWVKDDLGYVDDKEVVKRVNNAVRRTQPTFSIIDRPAIARSNQFIPRIISMFSSQRNKDHTLKLKNDVQILEKLKKGDATEKDWGEWGAKTALNRIWGPGLVALNGTLWGILFSKAYEDDERSFFKRWGDKYIDTSIGEIGPMASAAASEIKYLVSRVNEDVKGRKFDPLVTKTLENLGSDLTVLAKTMKKDDEILLEDDLQERNKKRAEAVEGLIRNAAILSGRGEYHFYDYFKAVNAWTQDEEFTLEIE